MSEKIFIYLASQSERRKELLRKIKIPFFVIPSNYHEKNSTGNVKKTVLLHALGKMQNAKVPKKIRNDRHEFILGADTLVEFKGKAIGKPPDMVRAREILLRLSGKVHRVYTGLALKKRKTGKVLVGVAKTKVKFKKWKLEQINQYLARVEPLDKAGAYAIQVKPSIVESYDGSLSNVIGLPVELLKKMLRSF